MQYIREDAAQSKKSYEDKFGAKGSKAAKAAKAAKEIEDAEASADADAKVADAKDGVASLSLNPRSSGSAKASFHHLFDDIDYHIIILDHLGGFEGAPVVQGDGLFLEICSYM